MHWISFPHHIESKTRPKSLWSLVLSPLVVIVGITGATGTSGIGFLDVTLSVRLKKQVRSCIEYHASPERKIPVFQLQRFMSLLRQTFTILNITIFLQIFHI